MAAQIPLSLTPDLVRRAYRPVAPIDLRQRYTPLEDGDVGAMVSRLLQDRPDGPVHIFSYGSLIWKPGFEVAARRRAIAPGWHRQFCLELNSWRGTPDAPGLMLALQPGGSCTGVALEVPEADLEPVMQALVKREIVVHEFTRMARWITLNSEGAPITALVFWAGPRGALIHPGMPLTEVAIWLARACGPIGSCAEYLYNTVMALEEAGIRDRNLWQLQHLVAGEIARLFPE